MTRHEIARALAGILADMPRSRNVDSNSDRIERAIQTLELRWGATLQVVPDNLRDYSPLFMTGSSHPYPEPEA